MANTHLRLWLFVPDCPLAATLMAAALAIYLLTGRRGSWFHLLTYTVLLKYGFWTIFVFMMYWAAGGSFLPEYVLLFVGHLGMLAEGAVFLPSVPQLPGYWWLAAGWSAVNDYFDYVVGVYPYLPNPAHLPVIRFVTLAITLGFVLTALAVTLRAKRPPSLAP